MHPLFEEHSLSDLAGMLPMYTESTLLAIKRGWDPPSRKFRATVVAVLKRPESELFTPEGGTDEGGTDAST